MNLTIRLPGGIRQQVEETRVNKMKRIKTLTDITNKRDHLEFHEHKDRKKCGILKSVKKIQTLNPNLFK